MQPRLTRSTTERILFGVCGGLGEYFAIDPVIVRIIFLLVTLTSGMGVPVYLVLSVVMPRQNKRRAPAPTSTSVPRSFPIEQAATPVSPQIARNAFPAELPTSSSKAPPGREYIVASAQGFQRQRVGYAGVPQQSPTAPETPGRFPPPGISSPGVDVPATGETVHLGDQSVRPSPAETTNDISPPQRRNWPLLGYIFVGIGGLMLVENVVGLGSAYILPIVLILAGGILLRRSLGRSTR